MDNDPAQPPLPSNPTPVVSGPPAPQVVNSPPVPNNMPPNQAPAAAKVPGAVLNILGIITLVIALILFLCAFVALQGTKIPSTYKQTTGQVYSLDQQKGTELQNNVQVPVIYFSPNIEFTVNGKMYKFHDPTGSSPSSFHVGQTVNVAYNPGNPGSSPKNASDKAGDFGAVIFGIIGFLFLLFSVVTFVMSHVIKKKIQQA